MLIIFGLILLFVASYIFFETPAPSTESEAPSTQSEDPY